MATDDTGGPPGETWSGNLRDPQRWEDFFKTSYSVFAGAIAGSMTGNPIVAGSSTLIGAYTGITPEMEARYPRLGLMKNTAYSVLSAETVALSIAGVTVGMAQTYQASGIPDWAVEKIQMGTYLGGGADSVVYRWGPYVIKKFGPNLSQRFRDAEISKMEKYGDGTLLPKFGWRTPGGYAMDYAGSSLLKADGIIIPEAVVSSARARLALLHADGFVHRDIAARNITAMMEGQTATKLMLVDPLVGVPWLTAEDDLVEFDATIKSLSNYHYIKMVN